MAKCTQDPSVPVKSSHTEKQSLPSEDRNRSGLRTNGQWNIQALQIAWDQNVKARKPISVRGIAETYNVPDRPYGLFLRWALCSIVHTISRHIFAQDHPDRQ